MNKKIIDAIMMPTLYVTAALLFAIGVFFIGKTLSLNTYKEHNSFVYVSRDILLEDVYPVLSNTTTIIRPYTDSNVKIVKYFYDYTGDKEIQEKSLIYYENTYMQNSGVDYSKGEEAFDVVAILDGVVINVTEDTLFGKIVEIRHTNDMISIYQSLSETTLNKEDKVTQGQIIGKSGISNIDASLNNHLHFEILHNGQVVNPENYYDKMLKDL